MANIILTWEYERDSSHIARLKYLYNELTRQNHQVYMIGADLPPLETGESIVYLPAPRAPAAAIHKPGSVTKIGGFGDRLAMLGFKDAKTLYNLTAVWDNYFQLIHPDLIICDAAPIASLAAYKSVPCIQLSDALSLPPYHLSDFPRLRPDAAPLASSRDMLMNVQYVQNKRNKASPPVLPAILHSDYTFITHIPEFDPYLTFRPDTVVSSGPYNQLPAYSIHHERNHFFACLDLSYPDIEETIIGLGELDQKGILYLQGATSSFQQFLQESGHIICKEFPALDEILPKCAFVIHHGNVAVAEAALSAGLPQFTLPATFENDWVGRYLVNIGVCIALYPHYNPVTTTAKSIQTILDIKKGCKDHNIHEWSALRAQHLREKSYVPLESAVMNACENLLTRAGLPG